MEEEHKDEIGELWQLDYHNGFECIMEVEKIVSFEIDDIKLFEVRGLIVDCKETDNTKIGDSVLFSWKVINHLTRTQVVSIVKRFLKLTENSPGKEQRRNWWWQR